mmetsp:Transcript_39066/g.87680  ORF Transcript_39066/g.87680 Transcript_39066/m.87680 type:complete len:309 (+) Transcript_39066:3614-4540(+)
MLKNGCSTLDRLESDGELGRPLRFKLLDQRVDQKTRRLILNAPQAGLPRQHPSASHPLGGAIFHRYSPLVRHHVLARVSEIQGAGVESDVPHRNIVHCAIGRSEHLKVDLRSGHSRRRRWVRRWYGGIIKVSVVLPFGRNLNIPLSRRVLTDAARLEMPEHVDMAGGEKCGARGLVVRRANTVEHQRALRSLARNVHTLVVIARCLGHEPDCDHHEGVRWYHATDSVDEKHTLDILIHEMIRYRLGAVVTDVQHLSHRVSTLHLAEVQRSTGQRHRCALDKSRASDDERRSARYRHLKPLATCFADHR